MEKISEAEGEQARVMADIEQQEIAKNAKARENARKAAKVREEIIKLEEITQSAERVLTVSKAEADFANGKEEEAVNKEQAKNDMVQANWDERNRKWMHDLDGAKTELEFLKEQLKARGDGGRRPHSRALYNIFCRKPGLDLISSPTTI